MGKGTRFVQSVNAPGKGVKGRKSLTEELDLGTVKPNFIRDSTRHVWP